MISVRRALLISFVERYAQIIIALGSNIAIARLLTPGEIGTYSVSLAAVAIAQVLRDFGIGNFILQERNLSDDHIRTAFGLSLILGFTLFVTVYSAAPFVGAFYNNSAMPGLIRLSALNFLILPFCSISLALLRRAFEFKRILVVTVTAAAVGAAVTVALAALEHGAVSLAIGAITANLLTGLGAWLARRDRQLLFPNLSRWREMTRFGGLSAAASVISSISYDANDLITGKLLGFSSVAIISRAQGLMYLFHRDVMGAIRGVAHPAFARFYRMDEDLESKYCHSVALLSGIALPIYGFLGLFPLELLRLLFGHQWDAAAPLVPWFCAAGAVATLNSLIPTLLTARGRVDIVLKMTLLIDPTRLIAFALALIVFRNELAFAVVFFVFFCLSVPVAYAFKNSVQPSNYRQLFTDVAKSVLCTAPAIVAAAALASMLRPNERSTLTIIPLFACGSVLIMIWFVMLLVLKHPLIEEPFVAKAIRRRPCNR